MQITLYSAAQSVRELLEQIDPETGELPAELEQAREIVTRKAQACAAFVLENDAQADMVEQHAKALMERVKQARKRSEWLRQYIGSHMAACGITEIKADDGTFKASLQIGRDESVELDEGAEFPPELCNDPKPPAPSKTKIKAAILAGQAIAGARIVRKDRLTIK